MPKIMGIKLIGKLPNWVSAKDRLEMLRRYNVTGGRGYILEYYGPGLKTLAHGIVMSSPYGYRTGRDNFFRLMTPL
jgi:aconitase A